MFSWKKIVSLQKRIIPAHFVRNEKVTTDNFASDYYNVYNSRVGEADSRHGLEFMEHLPGKH